MTPPPATLRHATASNTLSSRLWQVIPSACRDYARKNWELGFWGGESESERAAAGFAPTTPIIGRKRVAEQRARDAMMSAS